MRGVTARSEPRDAGADRRHPRSAIPRYAASAQDVRALVESVNGRFGTAGWTLVRYLPEHHDRARLAALYRRADACLVTSPHDKVNLVAKGYVAAHSAAPGTLVLSKFTGASRELLEACLINPYDIDGAADLVAESIALPADARAEAMKRLYARVRGHDVYEWAREVLTALDDVARRHAARRFPGNWRRSHSSSAAGSGTRRDSGVPLRYTTMVTGTQSATRRRPRGVVVIGAFAMLAAFIATVSAVALRAPGSALARSWWSINPAARAGFVRLGTLAPPLLVALALVAATAGVGLLRGRRWAWWLTVVGFALNLVGDLGRLVATGEVLVSVVGVAVVGMLLAYLASPGVRRYFGIRR